MADPRDVFVDVLFAFGAEAGRAGCTLGDGTPAAMRALFTNSVEHALREQPDAWERPGARSYVLKQVARIGREAARVAKQTPGSTITRDIFLQSAQEVITQQQLVCERIAAERPQWAIISGTFCMHLRWEPDL
jgi:hypothetical protein